MGRTTLSNTLTWKALALGAGLGLGMLSYPVHATPASGGDTVQGLYQVLLSTMKNGRILGQSGRFTQLDPVIRRSFDIASMARLSVGPTWASLSEAQRQQTTRRSEFATILRNEGIDGLIAALNRKADILTGTSARAS